MHIILPIKIFSFRQTGVQPSQVKGFLPFMKKDDEKIINHDEKSISTKKETREKKIWIENSFIVFLCYCIE